MARITDEKLQELIDTINEIRSDVAALRADFTKHDHGSTYAQGVLVYRTAVCSVSSGEATATDVTLAPPASAQDFYLK